MAKLCNVVDGWARAEAARQEQFRQGGGLAKVLPGAGWVKFFALLVLLPLLISEALFPSTGQGANPTVIVSLLLGVMVAFIWRTGVHKAEFRLSVQTGRMPG